MTPAVILFLISAALLSLGAAAKLVARRAARPELWKICCIALVCVGAIALMAAIITPASVRGFRHEPHSECMANLKQMDGAKGFWAREMHKSPGETPLDAEIFGDDKYIRRKATCPAGGIYTLGPVGERARCSLGHTYPGPTNRGD